SPIDRAPGHSSPTSATRCSRLCTLVRANAASGFGTRCTPHYIGDGRERRRAVVDSQRVEPPCRRRRQKDQKNIFNSDLFGVCGGMAVQSESVLGGDAAR